MKITVLVGLAVVAAVLGLTLWSNQGSRLILKGSIQKVRLQAVDENNTAVVVEVRLNNPGDLPYQVKEVAIVLESGEQKIEGTVFRQKDAERFMEFYKPTLGPRFNDSIRIGERLPSQAVVDRTIAASFGLQESVVAARRSLTILLKAVDGAVDTRIVESKR